jgi:hypothetical protein
MSSYIFLAQISGRANFMLGGQGKSEKYEFVLLLQKSRFFWENRLFMVRGKKTAEDTQPSEKLHPPISFNEAHLEHIQIIFKA